MRGRNISFIFAAALFCVLACKPQKNASSHILADTSVSLARLQKHFTISLELSNPVEQVNQNTQFRLVAVKTSDGPNSKRYDVYYVDRDPNNANGIVAMSFNLLPSFDFNVEPRVFYIYLDLERASPAYQKLWQTDPYNTRGWYGAYSNHQRVFIGRAAFSYGKSVAEVRLTSPLEQNKALIVADPGFEGNGQIALHYMDNMSQLPDAPEPGPSTPVTMPTPKLENISCVKQSSCGAIPMEEVCGTKISASKCRPERANSTEVANFTKAGMTTDLKSIGEGSFALRPAIGLGKIFFASSDIAATKDDNEKLCEERLGFLIRDGGGVAENPACKIARETSAEPKNGKLYCGISVSFETPRDVHEYTCNITGVFRGAQKELQTVQVIYGEG